jgi:hypothetical protein
MTQIMIATRKPQPFAAQVLRLHQPEIAAKAPPLTGDGGGVSVGGLRFFTSP